MKTEKQVLPISIVIPTYFEEKLLPRLLDSIKRQTVQPKEVIVADAFSTDKTREIAIEFGARVVDGGKVAVGRNNGANAAHGEILIFLDADTYFPTSDTLQRMYNQFIASHADIASTFLKPDQPVQVTRFRSVIPHVMLMGINATKFLQRALKRFVLAELGICIMVKKQVYLAVGGFKPEYVVADDKQFFLDAVKMHFRYTVLSVAVITSTRRYQSVRKIVTMSLGLLGAFVLGAVGVKATAPLRQRLWKMYGELGGKQQPSR